MNLCDGHIDEVTFQNFKTDNGGKERLSKH